MWVSKSIILGKNVLELDAVQSLSDQSRFHLLCYVVRALQEEGSAVHCRSLELII